MWPGSHLGGLIPAGSANPPSIQKHAHRVGRRGLAFDANARGPDVRMVGSLEAVEVHQCARGLA